MKEQEDLSVFDNIIYYLENEGLEYDLLEHDHVHSSEQAANIRGTHLEEAAKALVLKGKDGIIVKYFMCVVSGHKRLDLKKVKAVTGLPNVALAHPDKVLEITGLPVGKIPPFPFLFDLDGYVDTGVLENEKVCFSAASNYKSIVMKSAEWCVIASVPNADIAQEN